MDFLNKIKEKFKKNAFIISVLVITISLVISLCRIFYLYYFENFNAEELVNLAQLIAIPISIYSALLAVLKYFNDNKKALLFKRAEFTNEFVDSYRALMPDLSMLGYGLDSYLSKHENKNVKNFYNSLEEENLNFDRDFFVETLECHDIKFDEMQQIIIRDLYNVDKNKNFIDGIVQNAVQQNYTTESHACKFSSLIAENFQKEIIMSNQYDIEIAENPSKKQDILDKKKKHKKTIKMLNTGIAADAISETLNDLECVCLNTKFDLISYEQVYDLIMEPFNVTMKHFYIRIMVFVLMGDENDRFLFTNIRLLYRQLSVITKRRKSILDKKMRSVEKSNNSYSAVRNQIRKESESNL